MKTEKNLHLSNKIKEIVMKTLIVIAGISIFGGAIISIIFINKSSLISVLSLFLGMGISFIYNINLYNRFNLCGREKRKRLCYKAL